MDGSGEGARAGARVYVHAVGKEVWIAGGVWGAGQKKSEGRRSKINPKVERNLQLEILPRTAEGFGVRVAKLPLFCRRGRILIRLLRPIPSNRQSQIIANRKS